MLTFDDDEVTGPASVYDPTGADSRRGSHGMVTRSWHGRVIVSLRAALKTLVHAALLALTTLTRGARS
ncbi:hypothetical protein LZC95_37265 [Pendulispora brunnea]|uniref:Uncharacterized protein n=1 Tax=Pendulispora brunnea TaxID=2905690 RepID=A0ABZ2K4N6_9BACT